MVARSVSVFVIDDDQAVRDSLGLLLRSMGQKARLFDSAQAFLDAYDAAMSGCIVLDIRMPGMSGMELQQKLKALGSPRASRSNWWKCGAAHSWGPPGRSAVRLDGSR